MPANPIRLLLALGCMLLSGSASLAAQPSEIHVEFLGGDAARKAIVDESIQPYFGLLEPMEMTAKTGRPIVGSTIEQQRDECRGRYADAVREFTEEEKDGMRWYVERVAPEAGKDFPLLARMPWSFIKVSRTLEGGLPHTRGTHIILPETLVAQMAHMTQGKDPEWLALVNFGEVLVHEQAHVIQRQRPAEFAALYEQVWGFQHAKAIEGCPWLTSHQMLDPDGIDQRWVFPLHNGQQTRWILPTTVLPGEGSAVGEMRKVAVDLEPTGDGTFRVKVDASEQPVMQDLAALSDYWHRFLPSHSVYHPNEIAADLLARIVLAEDVLPGKAPAEANGAFAEARRVFKPLQERFGQILGASAQR